jgi:peptidoglycan/LPS O-acetylase OafA/YrhL
MLDNLHKSQLHPKYRPDIDGLRALAVLSVVAFHAYPKSVKGGFIGVDIFFVISGYLISTIIFENLYRGTFSFTDFYTRRIKRIFPALLLVLTACLLFGWFILLADEFNQLGKHVAAGASFISNLVFWDEAGYFDNAADTKPLLHLWSLGIEEQFYLVWPLILWLAWKFRLNLLIITILFAITSFALNINVIKSDEIAAFYSPQTRFWELLTGSLLAWITLYKNGFNFQIGNKIEIAINSIFNKNNRWGNNKAVPNIQSLFGLALLIFGFWQINKDLSFPGYWALVPVLGATLLLAAGPSAIINRTILSNKIVVWFGLISFPLYLWHWPLLSFARIYENEVLRGHIRITAVILSILFAWLTYKFIERPIRFGKSGQVKVAILCSLVFLAGVAGAIIYKHDFTQSHTYEKLAIKRKGSEYAYGFSMAWYRGKGDWLFLGNAYQNSVAKLKLANLPAEADINDTKDIFSKVAKAAAQYGTKVVLIVGPDKSSIYPEYLPAALVPSPKKYISFFLDELKDIPNLTVYNPTDDLLRLKASNGILYWMTDTHWNNRGAFLAYSGFSKLLGLPTPQVSFQQGTNHIGDLIDISKLKNFPLHREDNWDVVWKTTPVLTENEIPGEQKTAAFGLPTVVNNQNPLSNKYVWIIGDSFTGNLRQYFNATFKEVRYVGPWGGKIKDLAGDLERADRKPDMIVVIRVERSF